MNEPITAEREAWATASQLWRTRAEVDGQTIKSLLARVERLEKALEQIAEFRIESPACAEVARAALEEKS